MPVIGLDLGSDNMVIALALRGGIDVIVNEFSRRSTPTVVSFTEKNREIGETALNMIAFNGPNTVPNVKRVIGLKYSQIPKEELQQFPCKVLADENDDVVFEVQYLDQIRRFTSVQILAMVLTKARLIAEQEAQAKGIEAVISIPAYFTDKQRRAVLQAADIAGIRVISLLSDTLAAATEYTIYRTIEEKQTLNVAFVDVGHSDTTVSIMAITKNQARVLATGFHRDLGARDFETVLLNHLIAQAASKYKLDVNSNMKAKTKLARECEKLKKVLSINPKAQIRLECFMNDMDVAFEVSRDEFEQMSQALLTNFADPIQKTLAESKLKPEQINFVELFGGGSYIPSLRKIISQTFNLPVSTTLNAAETIARGCAFQGALMTPYFRLAKDVNVIDAIPFPVNLGYKSSTSMEVDTTNELDQVNKQSEVFKVGEGSPNTKLLTFSRNGDFELYALYGNSDRLAKGTEQFLSKFTVQKVPAKQSTVKVRVKHNHNGIVVVDQAELVEEVEVLEEPKPAPAPAPAPAAQPAEGAQPEAPKQEAPKVVKKTIRTELPVAAFCPYELTPEQFKKAKAEEEAMQAQDRLIIETAEQKNNVETFVYSYREKLDGAFAKFVDPKLKDQFLSALDAAESWLYDDGAETTKEEYLKKIASLQTFALPAENRKSESEARSTAAKSLEGWISQYAAFVASTDEKYSHITPAEKEKVAQKVDETKNWLSSEISKINAAPAHVDPTIKAADIAKKEKELKSYCDPIVTKPKPEPPKQEEKKEEAPKPEPAQTQQQPQEKGAEMDVE